MTTQTLQTPFDLPEHSDAARSAGVTTSRDSRPLQASDVPRVEKLSYRDFVHDFQKKRRPVVITDATQDWAARSWTPETLQSRAGNRDVVIRTDGQPQTWRFKELVDVIHASTAHTPAPYARNIDIQRDLPELWPDVRPRLKYATPDWKSSRLLPRDFVFRNGLEELFFGGAGTIFSRLHIDYWGMDGFVSQIYGRKEFILLDRGQTPFVYSDPADPLGSQIVDVDNVDLERFPLWRHACPVRLTLHPGETLYNPNGFWHTTMMREVSLTVITATWNSSNWSTFCQEYRRREPGSRLKKTIRLAQLIGAGALLRLREHLASHARR